VNTSVVYSETNWLLHVYGKLFHFSSFWWYWAWSWICSTGEIRSINNSM